MIETSLMPDEVDEFGVWQFSDAAIAAMIHDIEQGVSSVRANPSFDEVSNWRPVSVEFLSLRNIEGKLSFSEMPLPLSQQDSDTILMEED